jgi:excisionase family DNA binding protein
VNDTLLRATILSVGVNQKGAGAVENVEREWISYRECTELTGLSRVTIWKIISAGHIRAAKVGKSVLINRRSLEHYLEEQDYVNFDR